VSYPFDMRHRKHPTILIAIALTCLELFAACGPTRSTKETGAKVTTEAKDASVKRYNLTGRAVSVDKPNQSINVDGDAIPGFMAAMTMSYQVKDTKILDKVAPGDQIKAEIVVGNDGAYLENIAVVTKTSVPNPTK
jgi:Cu/Ag efflux protein CusF